MDFRVFDLGLVDFAKAWQFQKEVFDRVERNCFNAGLLLCRHYPVITVGRQGKEGNIKVSSVELKKKGIGLFKIERGGDVTYHGPGQLTAYQIFNLSYFKKDIHLFLRQLEELTIDFLSEFGINSRRLNGLTGVWAGDKKIASIGIAIRRWITFHGISINIKKGDLGNFRFIRPCGMDVEMTSLETVSGTDIEIAGIKKLLIDKFNGHFSKSCRKEVNFTWQM